MDILDGQVRIVVANDLVEGDVLVNEFQDILHRNARARDAWLTEVNSWINSDSVHLIPPSFPPVMVGSLSSHTYDTCNHGR